MPVQRRFDGAMASLGIAGGRSPELASDLVPTISFAEGRFSEEPLGHRHGGVVLIMAAVGGAESAFAMIAPTGRSTGLWITRHMIAQLDATTIQYYGVGTFAQVLAHGDAVAPVALLGDQAGYGSGWPDDELYTDDVFMGVGRHATGGLDFGTFYPTLIGGPGTQHGGFQVPLDGIFVPRGFAYAVLTPTLNVILSVALIWTQNGGR